MPVWGFVLAFFTATAWALTPIFIKEGMKGAGPYEVNPIRSVAAFVTMLIVMIAMQPEKLPTLTPYLVLGLFFTVVTSAIIGDQLYIHSIDKIGPSLAVSVSSGYPLVTTLCSIWMLGEKITALVWGGTFVIILGLLIIRYDASRKRSGNVEPEYDLHFVETRREKMKGFALAIAAAIIWGANIPFLKTLMIRGNWSGPETYFLRSAVFMIIAWALRFVQNRRFKNNVVPLRSLPLRSWLAFIGNGTIGVALGGVTFAMCIRVLPVSVVTPITASSPFITVLLARVFMKEKLTATQGAGIALVIAGSIAVSL